jgi:hypothetical protein
MENPGIRLRARNRTPIPISRMATYVEPRLALRINPSQEKIPKKISPQRTRRPQRGTKKREEKFKKKKEKINTVYIRG